MTAAGKDRVLNHAGTPEQVITPVRSFPVRASTTIYGNTIIGLNTSGIAGPASSTFSTIVGCSEKQAVGGAADGDVQVRVRRAAYPVGGAGGLAVTGTAFTVADIGVEVYAVDDSTVSKSSSGNQAAGYVDQFIDGTPYVFIGAPKGGVGA